MTEGTAVPLSHFMEDFFMAYKFSIGAQTLSGSVTLKQGLVVPSGGTVNLQDDAIQLTDVDIDGGTNYGAQTLHQTQDKFPMSDNGTNKSITFSDLEDSIFANVSGDATIAGGGALTIANDAVEQAMIADDAVGADQLAANAVVNASIASNAAIDMDKLDGGSLASSLSDLAQGDLLIAADVDDSNNLKSITFSNLEDAIFGNVSGDATIAAGGALTIAAGAVEGSMVADDLISAQGNLGGTGVDQADEFLFSDAGTLKAITFSNLEDAIFGNVSGDATIAAGGALTIANDAVEQAMIADDAVGADQLAANAVVNASVASGAAIAASKIDFNVDLGGNVTFGNQSNDTISTTGHLTVGGNLTVNGTTTSVNSTTINISSSFTFEGPADDHETTLSCGTPTQDNEILLPQFSGSSGGAQYHLPVLANATTAASALVTAAEFALLDGGSTVGTTALASGDGFLHNDAGTMKQTSIDKLADFFAGGSGLSAASGVMSVDIDGLTELDAAPHATQDEFMVSDNGTEKRVSMTNVANGAFALVSGDATIASGGVLTIANDAVESGMLNDNVISGQTELTSGNVADADEMLISDGGTLKKVGVDSLRDYMALLSVNAIGDANATLAVGINAPSAASSTTRTWTLPASAGLAVGDAVIVKAYGNSGTNALSIAPAGSQEIDGSTSNLVLESDNAAVTLYYVASDTWIIV